MKGMRKSEFDHILVFYKKATDEEVIERIHKNKKNAAKFKGNNVHSTRKLQTLIMLHNSIIDIKKDHNTEEYVITSELEKGWERRIKCPEKYRIKFLLDKGGE